MAQRRMFSPEIVGTDAFIEMPLTAQVLYFHLGMRADDDGFVNPNITMRMTGANTDDLRVLLAKHFLIQFNNGVVVVKHWRINNFIRRDRYKPTNYLEERNTLRVKENMAYTLDESQGKPISEVPWKNESDMRLSSGQPVVNAGEDRIGKDRIGKDTSHSHISFLRKVPNDTLTYLSERYKISPKGIQEKATDLLLYCEQKGRLYKNYKSFLENAIRKDKPKLQASYPYMVQVVHPKDDEVTLTPDQIARNKALKASISTMLHRKVPKEQAA